MKEEHNNMRQKVMFTNPIEEEHRLIYILE